MMIVVTGATGQLGSQIVDALLERVPAAEVAVSVREPARAVTLADRGVRVRAGDYADPQTLADSFAGATQVLLVSAGTTGGDAVAQHEAAAGAAYGVGAQRVVYTSHMGAAADSLFAPMPDHAATEAALEASARPFTSLRNGFYASTVPRLLGPALRTGEIVVPADGPVSWTTHADLAAAAAVILTDGGVEGPTPPLTASEAVDFAGIAAILSELTGRPIRRVVADDDEWVAGMVGHGVPQDAAQMLLGMFRASRRGEFAATDPTLGSLLGRRPQSLRSVLEQVVAAG